MRWSIVRAALVLIILSLVGISSRGAATGTEIWYQGQLSDAGTPANGTFDFQFTLHDAPTGGNTIGPSLQRNGVTVGNGLFATDLDFGAGAFVGNARWLQISVRPTGDGPFTTLTPRQSLAAVPYALYAMTPAGPTGPAGPKGDKGDTGAAGPGARVQ